MRLAIVTSHPIQYYAPLFRQLAQRLDLHVFFTYKITPEDQAKAGFGVPFTWDVDLTSGYSHEYLENISTNPSLEHFGGSDTPSIITKIRVGGFDAVLVLGWHLKAFVQAIWAAKRAGLPVLMRGDSHLGTARSPLKRLVKAVGYPPALRTFDAALYVGQRSRLYWEHYGFPNGRLFFAPHCVDNDWFEARGTKQAGLELRRKHSIADDAHVMLFAGKLIDFKRPLDVVEAAAYSAAQGMRVTVLVAGAGPLEDAMKRRATEAAVDLVMLGFCNQTQMPAAYAAADALVVASNAEETWGLVANEALACGTPIIVSDACGCSEDLCSDPEAGQSFPVGEHLALAHRFAEVIQSARSTVAPKKMAAAYSLAAAADGIELALAAVTR